jgi:Uncharacterized conserved protein
MVLFDRSWYNRAMVEPVFGFCSDQEYDNFTRGVTGFEKDLVRQGDRPGQAVFQRYQGGAGARFCAAAR